MDALDIFRIVAAEFADVPDDDVVDPETGKRPMASRRSWSCIQTRFQKRGSAAHTRKPLRI